MRADRRTGAGKVPAFILRQSVAAENGTMLVSKKNWRTKPLAGRVAGKELLRFGRKRGSLYVRDGSQLRQNRFEIFPAGRNLAAGRFS